MVDAVVPPLRGAAVVESFGGEVQVALFVLKELFSCDAFPLGAENVGSDVARSLVAEFGESPYAWHVLHNGQGREPSSFGLCGVEVFLVKFTEACLCGEGDELFEEVDMLFGAGCWQGLKFGAALVEWGFDVISVHFEKNQ